MADVDPINAVVAFLRAQPDVAALVGSRVEAEELPDEQSAHMPRAAIVVSLAGGGLLGRGYQEYGDVRVDIDCYGVTQRAARTLYLAVRPALKHLRREVVADSADTRVLLHWARLSAGGTTARDPRTDWPVCISSWQIFASEVAIPA